MIHDLILLMYDPTELRYDLIDLTCDLIQLTFKLIELSIILYSRHMTRGVPNPPFWFRPKQAEYFRVYHRFGRRNESNPNLFCMETN